MKIDSQALTNCEISSDGKAISLGFVDADGRSTAIRMPLDQVGALAMTLPGLIEKALRTQYRDDSLRYTYPLGSWKFEQSSDPRSSIVTLRTTDGFSVCFAMPQRKLDALREALSDTTTPDAFRLPN